MHSAGTSRATGLEAATVGVAAKVLLPLPTACEGVPKVVDSVTSSSYYDLVTTTTTFVQIAIRTL